MTAKRFTITQDFEEHHRQIRDNGHIIMGCFVEPQAEVIVDLLNEQHETIQRLKQNIDELLSVDFEEELFKENEQLKQVLGSILIEVRRDISATNHSGEVKAFVNPNSFELISEVLKKYGALKDWYE